jgi:AcrR family transcriptional regulator
MPRKSDATRARVLDAALELFRTGGFDATTMRDVARAAGLSLGAAYYYFRSKEDLVLAYYLRLNAEHEARARAAFTRAADLRERLRAVLHTKLDVAAPERKLLGVLLRAVGDSASPLSVFGAATRRVRAHSIALFAEALAPDALPEDLRALLPPALWLVHLGLLVQLLHDTSPKQKKTRLLADTTVDLLLPLIALARQPHARPARERLVHLARTMGWQSGATR